LSSRGVTGLASAVGRVARTRHSRNGSHTVDTTATAVHATATAVHTCDATCASARFGGLSADNLLSTELAELTTLGGRLATRRAHEYGVYEYGVVYGVLYLHADHTSMVCMVNEMSMVSGA
jgi:hypothetical protein